MKNMIFKKKQLVFLVFSLFLTASALAQNDSEPWKTLFNGKNLEGWKMVGSKGVAIVDGATIICHQTPNTKEHTFVCTNEKFKDFIQLMRITERQHSEVRRH